MRLSSKRGWGDIFASVSVCSSLLLFCFCFCVFRTGYRKWSFPWIGSGNFTSHFFCSNRQSIVWIGSETFTVFFSLWIGQRRFSLFEMWSTRNLCIQKFQRALVIPSSTARVVAVPFDGVSDVRLGFRHQI
jgi:hypothetical protein